MWNKSIINLLRKRRTGRETIRMSCESLEADGTIEDNYKETSSPVWKNTVQYRDHAEYRNASFSGGRSGCSQDCHWIYEAGDKPVSFDPEDPEKDAQLFFTLASCDPEQHLNNMARLSELLMNEEVVEALTKAETS